MDKTTLDNKFNQFIPTLENTTIGLLAKAGKETYNPYLYITEAYLYLVKKMDKLNTPMDIEKIATAFIKQNISWYNSKTNIENRTIADNDIFDEVYNLNEFDKFHQIELEETNDFDNKIAIEKWYSERLAILNEYYHQETDEVKRRVFEVYFIKGKKKGKDFSQHFGSKAINKDSAAKYIRQLKADIRKYYEDNYLNYKNNKI